MTELMIAFASTHDAIRAEQVLLARGLSPQVMPLPSQIQAGCGLCLRVGLEDERAARGALAGIESAYYLREKTSSAARYTPRPAPPRHPERSEGPSSN